LPTCVKCVYGATCGRPTRERDDCLPTYKHYVEGDPRLRLLKLQRSGEIDIVIGGEGEHCVNANWTVDEAYEHLANVCEDCGGLVLHDGFTTLVLMKPYGPTYILDWMHGKLHRISVRSQEPWWEAQEAG